MLTNRQTFWAILPHPSCARAYLFLLEEKSTSIFLPLDKTSQDYLNQRGLDKDNARLVDENEILSGACPVTVSQAIEQIDDVYNRNHAAGICCLYIPLLPGQNLDKRQCGACDNIFGPKEQHHAAYTCPRCRFRFCPSHYLMPLGLFSDTSKRAMVMELEQQLKGMEIEGAARWARLAVLPNSSIEAALEW